VTHTHYVGVIKGVHPQSRFVSESGLYSLILKSRKPEAKAFKKWGTSVPGVSSSPEDYSGKNL